ncbi:MAG: hypothetical protein EBX52_13700, partial [Proteobacteria bacterium]|nr:hypothetical protein [Pseudomonadota bacterium]
MFGILPTMPKAKSPQGSRSKVGKRYEPTTQINQQFPKPPRYYMGVLFSGKDRILFNDALFYHLDNSTVKIVNRDPKHPFDGECEIEKISYKGLRDGDEIEIDEIQYAIGIVTSDTTYVYRLFNHECEKPAILKLDEDDNLILEAEMELDSSKLVMG